MCSSRKVKKLSHQPCYIILVAQNQLQMVKTVALKLVIVKD